MRFLLKSAFMIFLLLLVVPFFAPFLLEKPVTSEQAAMPSPEDIGGAVSAARGTIEYMSGICTDKPEVCEDGAGILSFLGSRARQGAEIVYIYLGQHFDDDKKATSEKVTKPSDTSQQAKPESGTAETGPPTQDMVMTGAIGVTSKPAAPALPTQSPGPVNPTPDRIEKTLDGVLVDVPIPTRRPR